MNRICVFELPFFQISTYLVEIDERHTLRYGSYDFVKKNKKKTWDFTFLLVLRGQKLLELRYGVLCMW